MQETGVRGPKRMTDASLRCSFPEIGEMNSDQEIPGELVVSGGDTAEVFEPAKAALDDISAFVGAFVEAMDDDAVGFVGDDGLGAATNNFAAKVVAVTHTLCQRGARSWAARAPEHRAPPRYRHPGLGSDAGRPAGRADRSAHGFLSCGLRASGRLLDCAPPFPPEPHRCFLIDVESSDSTTPFSPDLASASKIAHHRPCLTPRLKRL